MSRWISSNWRSIRPNRSIWTQLVEVCGLGLALGRHFRQQLRLLIG